jgi:nitrogen fixation protein FixH
MSAQRRLHWGVGIAAVYTVFATATIGFVAFAISRPVDLVSADYYTRSLEHDDRLAALARARALGATLRCTLSEDTRTLALELPPELARMASGAVHLYRPSDGRADRTMPLRLDAGGSQQLSLAGLAHGRWTLQLEWRANGLTYYHERSLDLR